VDVLFGRVRAMYRLMQCLNLNRSGFAGGSNS